MQPRIWPLQRESSFVQIFLQSVVAEFRQTQQEIERYGKGVHLMCPSAGATTVLLGKLALEEPRRQAVSDKRAGAAPRSRKARSREEESD